MDHTYQSTMRMPSSYAVLSEEEMTYTEGGASITPEQFAIASLNVALNIVYLMGGSAVNYAVSTIKTGLTDGLSLPGIAVHFWDRLNPWSKVATVGLGVAGGFYVYSQVVSLTQTVKNMINILKGNNQQTTEDQTQQQALLAA